MKCNLYPVPTQVLLLIVNEKNCHPLDIQGTIKERKFNLGLKLAWIVQQYTCTQIKKSWFESRHRPEIFPLNINRITYIGIEFKVTFNLNPYLYQKPSHCFLFNDFQKYCSLFLQIILIYISGLLMIIFITEIAMQ